MKTSAPQSTSRRRVPPAASGPPAGAESGARLARRPSFFLAHSGAWLFIAVFGFVARLLLYQDPALAAIMTLVLDPIGYAMTGLFHGGLTRHGPVRVGFPLAAKGLAFCCLAALVQVTVGSAILASFGMTLPWRDGSVSVIPGIYYLAVFIGWFLLYVLLITWNDAQAAETHRILAEANATRAELDRLRSQLDPHFLYNTLNTIAAEIHDNPDGALVMTRNTAAFLRDNLEGDRGPVCSLAEETESVLIYLKIQEGRFEVSESFQMDISDAAKGMPVPRFALQVLVENAFKHGDRADLGLKVEAGLEGDRLTLRVRNRGRLRSKETSKGIGLANLQRRLDLHFPARHSLSLKQDAETVVAELVLEGTPCFA